MPAVSAAAAEQKRKTVLYFSGSKGGEKKKQPITPLEQQVPYLSIHVWCECNWTIQAFSLSKSKELPALTTKGSKSDTVLLLCASSCVKYTFQITQCERLA